MIIIEDDEFKRQKKDWDDTKLLFLPLKIGLKSAVMIYYSNTRHPLHNDVASVIIERMGLSTYYQFNYKSRIKPDLFLIFCGFILIDIYQKETLKLIAYNEKMVQREYIEWAKKNYKFKDNEDSFISEYKSEDEVYGADMKMVMSDEIIKKGLERYKNKIIKDIIQSGGVKGESDGR